MLWCGCLNGNGMTSLLFSSFLSRLIFHSSHFIHASWNLTLLSTEKFKLVFVKWIESLFKLICIFLISLYFLGWIFVNELFLAFVFRKLKEFYGKKDKVRNGKFNLIKEENLLDFFEIASNYPNKKIFIKISLHKFSNSKYNEKELVSFQGSMQKFKLNPKKFQENLANWLDEELWEITWVFLMFQQFHRKNKDFHLIIFLIKWLLFRFYYKWWSKLSAVEKKKI